MLTFFKTPPRVPELVFAAVLIWMFAMGQGWSVMLADGDTGWHVRNGERIIDTRSVPYIDPFSFGSGSHPWFAWEWLSDVLFAVLFRQDGLKAVAWFCGITIAASVSLLLRHMLWRSIGMHISFLLAVLTAGASSIHYLARPHVLGLLLFAIVCWMVDRDRAAPHPWIWTLPAIFALWANLHGSFLAGLAMLGLRIGETIVRRSDGGNLTRAAMLLGASIAATLCNPYGWRLHAHAIEYLQSGWIQSSVEEFQSPRFRSQSMLFYELLLLAGVAALPWLLRRKEIYPCCAILLWAHESLASVRHVPLYGLAASPFIGSWFQNSWQGWVRGCRADSLARTFDAITLTWRPWCSGYTVWPVLLAAWLAAHGAGAAFPANKFPVCLVQRNFQRLTSSPPQRVFSSDQWSDYLIFQLFPSVRVYFDGRSDFFGPWRGNAYMDLMRGETDSPSILDREGVEWALLPKDWALAGLLRRSSQWRVADADEQAVLFERNYAMRASASNQKPAARR
jgi:hypothetical protein